MSLKKLDSGDPQIMNKKSTDVVSQKVEQPKDGNNLYSAYKGNDNENGLNDSSNVSQDEVGAMEI